MSDETWTESVYLHRELCTYLDGLTITGDNIGKIRRSLLMPWDSAWNGIVRDETAAREVSAPAMSDWTETPRPPCGPSDER